MTSRWLLAALLLFAVPAWAQDESMIPTGTAESNNNSCSTANAHTTCDDDPDSPGADWCTASTCAANPTNATSWRFTFNTPATAPSFGTNAQTFDAYVKSCASGGTDASCTLDLYCNGSLVTTGPTVHTVSSSTGVKISQTHTLVGGGTCATDGSDVELRVTCTATGGTPSARRTVDLNAVEWDVTYASAGDQMMLIGRRE